MANLEAIIAEKSQQDNQWRAEMQADRENTIAMQDAGVEEITSSPELYVKYLEMCIRDSLGLGEGEGITLQGVGGIGHADAEIGVQFLHLVRGEGAALPDRLGVCVDTL